MDQSSINNKTNSVRPHLGWRVAASSVALTALTSVGIFMGSATAACSVVPAKEDPAVAVAVYREGVRRAVSQRVMLAAFEAGWVESHMNNLSCGDRDSLGVFQQRANWGTVAERTNPTISAGKFFDRATDVDGNANYRYLTAGQLAQKVQASKFGERYDQAEGKARSLLAGASNGATTGSVFAEGAFVKSDSSATVYRIAGGAPVPVSSMTLVGNSPITTLPAATINSLLASNPFPRDNTFVKSDSSATVYRMAGGTPVPISSMNIVGTSNIVVLNEYSIGWLNNKNPFPRDNTFVKSDSSATVYRMAGGTPVPISSMNIVGTSNIVVLNEYSIGWLNNKNPFPRDNTFVKSDSSATVYRMAGGTPVPISSMNIVGTSNIVVLNEWSINWLRSNNPFPRDNTFVKSDTSATVYRITGRTLVPLTSMTQVGTNTIVVLNEYSINWLHNLAAN